MKAFKFILSCLLMLSIVSFDCVYASDFELDNEVIIINEENPNISTMTVSHYTETELLVELEARMKTALLNGELEIDLHDLNLYYDDYANVWGKLNYITPFLPTDMTAIVFIYEGGKIAHIELSHTIPKEEVLSYFDKIEMEVNNILACVDDSMSDVEKALVVHDYLVDQYSYDYERYANGTMPKVSYRSSGLLLYGTGVCEAYGNLYMYIMNRLGIETIYTSGNKEGIYYSHLWDIIKLDGQYYHVDATWDDPVPDKIGRVNHNYFLLSDEAISSTRGLSSQTHTDWKRTDLVCSDTKYDNYWWYGIDTQIVIDGDYYYYAADNAFVRRHRTTNEIETIASLGKWYYVNGGYFKGTFSGIFKKDGFIYYNTEKSIYTYDLSTGSITEVSIPSLNGNRIYGIQCKDNQLNYIVGISLYDELTIQNVQLEDTSHKHNYTSKVTDSTCTDKGYTTYTCECGYSYQDNYNNALGHSFTNYISNNDGTKTAICDRCTQTNTINENGKPILTGVTRVFGNSRYETSFKVADTLKETLGVEKFNAVIIANGTNFADALAGSYLSSKVSAPILMTDTSAKNMNEVVKYVKANLAKDGVVYILGGTVAVPNKVQTDLKQFTVKRLAGNDRYATNLAILKEAGVTNEDLIIATGTHFADSLSASATGRPLLLVGKKLNTEQREFLESLKGNKLYIAGGEAAVNKAVKKELEEYGKVTRLAGSTRYETSTLIAKTFFKEAEYAVVALGTNFPDGLSGGPLAYAMNSPLLLTAPQKANYAITSKYTNDNKINDGYVLGGPTLLKEEVVKSIFKK